MTIGFGWMKALLHTAGALVVLLGVFLLLTVVGAPLFFSIYEAITGDNRPGMLTELARLFGTSAFATFTSLKAAKSLFEEHANTKIIAISIAASVAVWLLFVTQAVSQLPPEKFDVSMGVIAIVIGAIPPLLLSYFMWEEGWQL